MEYKEEDFYKPVRAGKFWSNNHIEYESKGNRKTPSIEEYLNKTRLYLKNIIDNLKKSDTWKIQLTIAINFIYSKDNDDEESVKHSKSDNKEIMIRDKGYEVIEELFDSFITKICNWIGKINGR